MDAIMDDIKRNPKGISEGVMRKVTAINHF